MDYKENNMSMYRYMIDLALPNPLPTVFSTKPTGPELTWMSNHTWLECIRAGIVKLKGFSSKINAGEAPEEDTMRAKWHICYHDEDPTSSCGPEYDI